MIDFRLFIGFPLESSLCAELGALPLHLKSLFVGEEADYLQQIDHAGRVYLGKDLGQMLKTTELDAIQAHVVSILHRLFPTHSIEKDSLVIMAIPQKGVHAT